MELSDYLSDTIAEAERLLALRSRLGRLPLPKKHECFSKRISGMIDAWFESEKLLTENIVGQCSGVSTPLTETFPNSETLNGLTFSDEAGDKETGPDTQADFQDNDDVPF